MASHTVVGRPQRRIDALERLTGRLQYAGDLRLPGMLHARLVVSPYAHARIRHIDTQEALAVPGVVAVLTARDLPIAHDDGTRKGQPLAREEVLFHGHPVAVVLAESEAAAEDGAERVRVDYEPLPALLDPLEAMRPQAPLVRHQRAAVSEEVQMHATVGGEQAAEEETLPPNVSNRVHYQRGDVAQGFREADVIVEATYRTQWAHQTSIEPQVAVAWLDPLGTLTIWSSTQTLFYAKREVAKVLGLPAHRVRIVGMPVGGGFGGKFVLIEPLIGAVAMAIKRPVRLAFTRMEEFLAANPAPQAIIEVKAGAKRDGQLTAFQARVIYDTGAFPGSPMQICCLLMGGAYRWPNLDIRGYEVMTNRVSPGAYRAPGAPQAFFALESTMDELARRLGLDPLEFRLQNACTEGDPMPDGTPHPRLGLRECLETLRAHPAWQERHQKAPDEGVGIAIGGWPGGLEPTSVLCKLEHDGTVSVVTGTVDLTGTNTTLALIAAEVLGLAPEKVKVVNGDTETAPPAGVSGGSKITYTQGMALLRAAQDARRQILAIAADQLEAAPEDLEIVDGTVRVRGVPSRSITFERIAELSGTFGGKYEPVVGRGASAISRNAPGYAAHLARVRVDRETGQVTVARYVAVQDVGFAIDPPLVHAQIHGGVAQGLGWALREALVYSADGQLLTASLMDYAVPAAIDLPPIESVLVEVPAPDGPFGAKGVGEPPVVPVPAAVANAIRDAVGLRLTELPMTAERVARALGCLAS